MRVRSRLPIVLFLTAAACDDERASKNGDASTDAAEALPDASSDAASIPNDAAMDAPGPDGATTNPFGAPCTMDGALPCPDGFICLSPFLDDGFCSQNCDVQGTACPGTPEGTAAYCIVGEEGTPNCEKGCAFICAGGGHEYACPGDLVCQPDEEPPGSGHHLCLPG